MPLLIKRKEITRETISINNTSEFLGQNIQYKVETKNIIDEYSSDLVTAYKVLQINDSHVNADLYAVVSNIPQTLNLSRFLSFINLGPINNLSNIIEYGISLIDGREKFAIILPYIRPEKSIKNYLHIFKYKSEIILQQVIIPILETLVQIHSADITHGSINPNNVFIENSFETNPEFLKIILSNTILDLCGYNQQSIFEPLNRMLVHRAGKSPLHKASDCYAVGMLLMCLFAGEVSFKGGYDAIISSKAKNGSYATVISQWFNGSDDNIDHAVKNLAYWLLHDDEEKRWDATQALKFLRRRHRKSIISSTEKITQADIEESKKLIFKQPFVFSSEECFSNMAAAVSSIRFYEDIKLKIKNGKLINALLENHNASGAFISKTSFLRSIAGKISNEITKEEIFLTLFIILLNNQMPIKIREVSVEPLGTWQMLQYFLSIKPSTLSLTLQKAMTSGLIASIYNIASQVCDMKIPPAILDLTNNLDKRINELTLHEFSHNAIAYFITCYIQSSIICVNDKICFNNSDLIMNINLLNQEMFNDIINDETIMCFMLGNIMRKNNKFLFKRIKT